MKTVLGIDIGTQGTKAALFTEEGRCLATAFRPSALHQPRSGVVEEDPEFQLRTVCQAIRDCARQSPDGAAAVAAIGLDGQMAGILGVGRDGRHVTPYDSWLDTRCAPYIERMEREAGDAIIEKTGGPVSFNHGPKILWWMHERPRVFRAIHAFVQPAGYAAMRLCGLPATAAFMDHTYLHFSGFADNRGARWDADLCRSFGLDPAQLPRIVAPQEIVGTLTGKMARACGLRAGVPVAAGCGDTAASFLAGGATREGISVDVAGTASVYAATTSVFRPDREHKVLSCGRAATPGLWHPYAYINGGGMNLEWFRREFLPRPAGSGAAPGLAALERRVARLAPAEDWPLFIPHLGGRVSPGWPKLRGAWAGLTWSHGADHLYAAMLEGVALEYRVYQEVLRALYPGLRLREIRVTGGGGQSACWNQIKADALGVPVARLARGEGAPLGAALVAAHGVGLVRDLPTAARHWIKTGETTSPRRALAAHYARRFARYQALLNTLHPWSQL